MKVDPGGSWGHRMKDGCMILNMDTPIDIALLAIIACYLQYKRGTSLVRGMDSSHATVEAAKAAQRFNHQKLEA